MLHEDWVKLMNWDLYEKNYWKYYLKLEQEFVDIMDYIEFAPENYSVYSVKLMQLLLSIGSEVDAVMKEICNVESKERPTIADYAPIVFKRYPSLVSQNICVFKRDVVLSPFVTWTLEQPSKSLPFWNAYNDIKHHRTERYNQASFGVVANALAALFALNMYRLNEIYMEAGDVPHNIPEEASKLFYLANWCKR